MVGWKDREGDKSGIKTKQREEGEEEDGGHQTVAGGDARCIGI